MLERSSKGNLNQRIQAKVKREIQTSLENTRQVLKHYFPWKFLRSLSFRTLVFQDPVDCIFYALSLENQPFFIQIGANDGIHGDPIYEFILKWNWAGIKVEPVSYIFEKLKVNFEGFPTITLENSAVAKENNSQTFYYLKQDKNAPEWYSQLGSFSLPTLLKHAEWIPDLQERLVDRIVPCLTFEALCQKHHVLSIDVIHIDTEGYDFEIIKLIDFQKFSPTIVLYEHKHLNGSDRASCEQYLKDLGYRLISTRRDTLAISEVKKAQNRFLYQAWKRLEKKL
jgi:FkbM family methyltransferase